MNWKCEEQGHLWSDADPCVACGMPWSECYDIVIEHHGDGTITPHVETVPDVHEFSLDDD
jgi:hypothetical protein